MARFAYRLRLELIDLTYYFNIEYRRTFMRYYVEDYIRIKIRGIARAINRHLSDQYPNDHNLRRLRRRDLRRV